MLANYYVVLGVSPEANPSQLRRGYRLSAIAAHADQDSAGGERLRQVREAYAVLSQPAEQKHYHEQFRISPPAPRPIRQLAHSPLDLFTSFERHVPSSDEIMELFNRNFTHRHAPKTHHARAVNVEVVLTPLEAIKGGAIQLSVPVFRPCDLCMGSGRAGLALCDDCGGVGSLAMQAQVDVIVAPRTTDGQIIPVSLSHLGIENLYLNVHVRVAVEPTAL